MMVQVQEGQDISQAKGRTKEAEGMTLRDLWSTNWKEADDQLDMGNGKKRGEVSLWGASSDFHRFVEGSARRQGVGLEEVNI